MCCATVSAFDGRCAGFNGVRLDDLAIIFNDLGVDLNGACSDAVVYSGGLIAALDRVCYAAASIFNGRCADFIGAFVDPAIFNGLSVVFKGACSDIAAYFTGLSVV